MAARRKFKQARRRVGGALLRSIGPQALAWFSNTWSIEMRAREHIDRLQGAGGYLIAMWHGRMIVPATTCKELGWHVLVSPSEDGDLSDGLLRRFGYKIVRGSSSRGGARALREMLAILDSGSAIVVTPDGPRGPMHSMNPGLAWMARATGRPVVPMGSSFDRAWHLDSWDRFTIPKLRARIAITFGEPIFVPRRATEPELAAATEAIRTSLLAVERDGFEHLKSEPDW